MMELVPAVLVHNKRDLVRELSLFSKVFSWVQLDIMDSKFVRNKTVSASAFTNIRTGLKFEVHLMTLNPLKHARSFSRIRNVRRIIFHQEACTDQDALDIINFCRKRHLEVGIAVNPKTKVLKIRHLLPLLDAVLVMGVTPGFSGQRFKPSTLKKFKEIRKLNKRIRLQFDGGVNMKNIKAIARAGAQRIAVRSALIDAPDLKQAAITLKRSV